MSTIVPPTTDKQHGRPEPYFADDQIRLYLGDSLEVLRGLPSASVDCCVTSPPYFGLRDYGVEGQYGLESSPAEYVEMMRTLFAEVRRVLADDGTLWLNMGDSYTNKTNAAASLTGGRARVAAIPGRIDTTKFAPYKSQLGIPWRVALALIDDGWALRNEIVWHKPNGTPESVTDRFTRRHEHVFLFAKSRAYWFDGQPNAGDVWYQPIEQFPEAHFATMPVGLASQCVVAGCPPEGTVLDPFSGSGTTGLAATKHGRKYVGIDLSQDYLDLSLRTRFAEPGLPFGEASA